MKAELARKMSTYQLNYPRNTTLHTQGRPNTGYLYCFRHVLLPGGYRHCVEEAAEKVAVASRNRPHRLKPDLFSVNRYGPKAVPFGNLNFLAACRAFSGVARVSLPDLGPPTYFRIPVRPEQPWSSPLD
jgi:hypothetical protein